MSANRLIAGTALERLGRVPAWADDLWARVRGRPDEDILVRRFGEALDRLGLAEVARAEVVRVADGEGPRGLALRYHLIALIEHAMRAIHAVRAFDFADPAFAARRAGLARIERLASDSIYPGGPFTAPFVPELSAEGVGAPEPPRREMMPVTELADIVVADTALLLEDVARAAMSRFG